ncbi:MAG: hypothetical protein ACLRY7_09210 [Hominenteromicrobium sp.]|uniref:hypothetical protein n=1 Tax=Hominenteromicrobium sp. TaxID=3073581 RepID=UPI00399EF007
MRSKIGIASSITLLFSRFGLRFVKAIIAFSALFPSVERETVNLETFDFSSIWVPFGCDEFGDGKNGMKSMLF